MNTMNSISLITNDFKWSFVELLSMHPFLEWFMKINVPLDDISNVQLASELSLSFCHTIKRLRHCIAWHIVIFVFHLTCTQNRAMTFA